MVHEGFVFTPRPEHIGRFVRLRVLPFDAGGLPGVPFGEPESFTLYGSKTVLQPLPFFGQFVASSEPITEAPPQNLICERSAFMTPTASIIVIMSVIMPYRHDSLLPAHFNQ